MLLPFSLPRSSSGVLALVEAGAPAALVATARSHVGAARTDALKALHQITIGHQPPYVDVPCCIMSTYYGEDCAGGGPDFEQQHRRACREASIAAGVVPAMLEVLLTGPVVEAARLACGIFIECRGYSEPTDERLAPAFVAALREHTGDVVVCKFASYALARHAVESAAAADAAAAAGAIPALVAALRSHLKDEDVSMCACYAISEIARASAGGCEAAIAARAAPVLAAAFHMSHDDVQLKGRASRAFHAIAASSAEGKAAVIAASAVPLLVAAAKTYGACKQFGDGKETFAEALSALGYAADGTRA